MHYNSFVYHFILSRSQSVERSVCLRFCVNCQWTMVTHIIHSVRRLIVRNNVLCRLFVVICTHRTEHTMRITYMCICVRFSIGWMQSSCFFFCNSERFEWDGGGFLSVFVYNLFLFIHCMDDEGMSTSSLHLVLPNTVIDESGVSRRHPFIVMKERTQICTEKPLPFFCFPEMMPMCDSFH